MIPSATAWAAYRQRRTMPLKPKKTITKEIEAAMIEKAFSVMAKGETPQGDRVVLLQINGNESLDPVIVLVVANEIQDVWESSAGEEAVGVFQRMVVLGKP